jgi:hypothetical protein
LNLQNITVGTGTATYEAASTIDATTFVVGSSSTQASVYLQAGTSITLQPGFHVFPGSTFYGYIAQPPTLQNQLNGSQTTGASNAQNISVTLPDPEGPSAIAGGNITFLITDAYGNITQQCPIGFTVNPALISLADATSSNQSMTLPGSGSISDSVCAITAISNSNPSVTVGSGGVTVTVNLTFFAAGTYQVIANVFDGSGVLSPWATMGTWTVTQAIPTFTMSAPSPSSLTLVTGGTTTFTETFQPQNGFNSSVSLSYSGGPSGLTFSPSSLNVSGSSPINQTITATASTATPPGNYTITITASGGGATQTSTLPVSVETFTLSPPQPTSLTMGQGANTTFVETLQAQNGFSSSVSLSYSGGPSGLTFSTGSVSVSGSSPINQTITATTTSGATPGNYTVTITATGGGVTQTATLGVTINAPPLNLTDNGVFVSTVYIAVLGRDPDEGGWLNYVNVLNQGLMTRDQVANSFLTSAEYQSKYYVNGSEPNNTTFLTILYQNALNRAPDEPGLNGYLAELSSGTTRSQIVETFIALQEFDNDQNARITADNAAFPTDVTPVTLGGPNDTTGYRPLLTGTPQYTFVYVTDPRGAQYINSGFVWFVTTDQNGNITQQCPVNYTSTGVVQVESTGQSSSEIVCTVSSGAVTNLGSQLLVSFYVTFSSSAPGNYTIMANATDVDGLAEPWTTLGTWALYTPNTSPTPTFTLSGPTSPVSLVAVSPDGGPAVPITVTVTGWNNFNSTVTFTSVTAGILASGSGGPGNVTANLQATAAGPTSLTLLGSSDSQDQYLTIPVSITAGQPAVTQIITTSPLGLSATVYNGSCTTPCSFQWTTGSTHTISAPSPQTLNGAQYTFTGWSDSGTQTHQITVGSSVATYTANYNGPPAPAPTLTLLQTVETIAAGGAASFPVYVSQSATTNSILGVTSWSGPSPKFQPSSITGPGWVTVIMYGPSVSSTTTYNFNISASASSGFAQAPATLTVNPTGLQPDFVLSTTTSPLSLAPSASAQLPVTIDVVDGYTGYVTFTSSTQGVSVLSGPLPAGSTNVLTVSMGAQLAPPTLLLTGSDNAGHAHQLLVNCNPGGGGGSPLTYDGDPQPYGTVVSVPINSSPVPYEISVPGMSESAAQNLLLSVCPIGSGTGVSAQVVGVDPYDSVNGAANLTLNFWTNSSAVPGVIQDALCLGIYFFAVAVATPSCSSPSISSLQVNGQNTNSIIEGTVGNITINGTCLRSTANVSIDGAGIIVGPPDPTLAGGWTDSALTVDYEAVACPAGQGTCATTGTHNLTVAAQATPGQTSQGSSDPLNGIQIFLTSIEYGLFGGNVPYYKDCPASLPGAGPSGLMSIPTTQWLPNTTSPLYMNSCENPEPQNEAVVWVANTAMEADVGVESVPAVTQNTPIWIEGIPAGGLPTLARPQAVTLAPNPGEPSSSVATELTGLSALPNQTRYLPDLNTAWVVSGQSSRPDPATCAQQGMCRNIGTSTNTLYVLLSQPQQTQGPPEEGGGTAATGVTRTAIHLATQGAAADQPSAFAQTWQQFSGNVTDWDNQQLAYYNSTTIPQEGLMACVGPTSNALLTQTVGDSCLWSLLFLEALAMNGIPVQALNVNYNNPPSSATSFAYACATDGSNLLFKNWMIQSQSNPYQGYPWELSLSTDGTDPNDTVGMVPAPSGGFGDLTPIAGLPGQNSATPSEKALVTHHVVVANGGYYDPSYQKSYSAGANLENLIFGYWVPNPTLTDPTREVARAPIPGQPNITFSWSAGPHATPTLISPVNLTGQSLTPTLMWSFVPGARSYTVNIRSGTTSIASIELSGANIPTVGNNNQVSYAVPGSVNLQSGTTYTWSVTSIDCSGTITQSLNAPFTTQ